MKIEKADLIRQVSAIEMAAQAMVLNARVLLAQLTLELNGEAPPNPSTGESAEVPLGVAETSTCGCPPKWRVVAPAPGHPGRTKCRQCGKEHD